MNNNDIGLLRNDFAAWFRQSGIKAASQQVVWDSVREATFKDDLEVDTELISANPRFFEHRECSVKEGDLIRPQLLTPGVLPQHYSALLDFVKRHEAVMRVVIDELEPPIDWELLTWVAIPSGLLLASVLKLLLS